MADSTNKNSETKITFADGERKLIAQDIINKANTDVVNYINYNLEEGNWTRKDADNFSKAYSQIIDGISKGNIDSRSAGLDWHDKLGLLANSKEKGFDAVGQVLNYLDPIVTHQQEQKLEDFAPTAFNKYFINTKFGGVDPTEEQWTAWRKLDGNKEIANLLNGYILDLDKYDFKNYATSKEDYINKIKNALSKLLDGKYDDDDIRAFSELGINISDYFKDVNATQPTSSEETPEDPEKKYKDYYNNLISYMDKNHGDRDFADLNISLGAYDGRKHNGYAAFDDSGRYMHALGTYLSARSGQGQSAKNSNVGKNFNAYRGLLHQEYQNYKATGQSAMWDNGDGTFYIPGSYNEEDLSGWIYDPTSLKLTKSHVKDIPALRAYFRNKYVTSNPIDPESAIQQSVWIMKLGGPLIKKYQEGGEVTPEDAQLQMAQYALSHPYEYMYMALTNNLYQPWANISTTNYKALRQQEVAANKEMAKAQELDKMKQAGYVSMDATEATPEEIKRYKAMTRTPFTDKGMNFSTEDYVDLAAVGADIASMISAWMPGYGTAASAGLGLTSSVMTLGTDISRDGFQWSDLGRFGLNAGADLMGLIPGFGSAAKTGKITGTLLKYVPKLMKYASIAGAGMAGVQAMPALKKLTSDKEHLTVADWKAIGNLIKAISGLSKAGAAHYKTKAMMNEAKTAAGEAVTSLKTTKGEIKLNADELTKFNAASDVAGKNTALKEILASRGESGKALEGAEVLTSKAHIWNHLWGRDNTVFKEGSLTTTQGADQFDFTKLLNGRWNRGPLSDAKILAWQMKPRSGFTWDWNWNPYMKGNAPTTVPVSPTIPTTTPTTTPIVTSYKANILGPSEYTPINPQNINQAAVLRILNPNSSVWNRAGRSLADNAARANALAESRWVGWAFKEGGKIQKAANGTILGIGLNQGASDWNSSVGNSTWDEIIKRLDADREYYKTINQAQDEHSSLRTNATGHWDASQSYKPNDNSVADYQTKYQNGGWNNIAIQPNFSRYDLTKGKRISGDKYNTWTSDNLYANITDDRRLLGRDDDYSDDLVNSKNAQLLKYNLKLTKGTDNYWRLTPLDETNENLEQNPNPDNFESFARADDRLPFRNRLRLRGRRRLRKMILDFNPDIIKGIQLRRTIRNNNRNFKDMYESLKPYIENTYDLNGRVLGDLATENYYNNEAARVENLGTHGGSSDAALNKATAFTAYDRAQQLREKGHIADNQEIKTTSAKSKEYQDDNIIRHNKLGNDNQQRFINFARGRAELRGLRRKANYQSWDTFLKELYNTLSTKREQLRQFNAAYMQSMLPSVQDDPYVESAYQTATTNPTAENQLAYQRILRDSSKKYAGNYYGNLASINGYYVPEQYNDHSFHYSTFKSGGSLDGAKIKQKYDDMINKNRHKDKDRFDKNMRHYYTEYMKAQKDLAQAAKASFDKAMK